jgi:hypothetical protein
MFSPKVRLFTLGRFLENNWSFTLRCWLLFSTLKITHLLWQKTFGDFFTTNSSGRAEENPFGFSFHCQGELEKIGPTFFPRANQGCQIFICATYQNGKKYTK